MRQQAQVDQVHGERGFTLVEMMIALVLFSFAVAGVLSVAVSITQGYREQRQAINAEAAVRSPLDFLTDAIRQASPGVQVPDNVYDYQTCVKGSIIVGNNTGLNSSDELDLTYASGGIVTTTRTDFDATSTTIQVQDGSQLAAGDYIMVTDLTNGMLVKIASISGTSAPYTITPATKCSGTLGWPSATANKFPKGSLAVRAQHAHFSIANITINSTAVPHLQMDPDGSAYNGGGSDAAEPLAEYIEDMQIAEGIDVNNDKNIAEVGAVAGDDDWLYNVASDTIAASTQPIRAIRVTLIARTARPLFGATSSIYFRPATEDHAAGANDGYRRRVLKAVVELRNISGSP